MSTSIEELVLAARAITRQEERERQEANLQRQQAEDKKKSEQYRKEWQRRIGWIAHERGLPYTTTAKRLMEKDFDQRQRERGLNGFVSWFELFCAEIRDGIEPNIPEYMYSEDDELRTTWKGEEETNWPPRALNLAKKAAEIFLKK